MEGSDLRSQIWQQIRWQASTVGGTGLFIGGIIGVAASILATTPADALHILTLGYQIGLPLAMSAMFILSLILTLGGAFQFTETHKPRPLYLSLRTGVFVTVCVLLVSVILATVTFIFPAINLPLLLRGYDSSLFYTAVGQMLLPSGVLVVTVVVLIVGVLSTVWAHFYMDA